LKKCVAKKEVFFAAKKLGILSSQKCNILWVTEKRKQKRNNLFFIIFYKLIWKNDSGNIQKHFYIQMMTINFIRIFKAKYLPIKFTEMYFLIFKYRKLLILLSYIEHWKLK
jgi:hypothetical protein